MTVFINVYSAKVCSALRRVFCRDSGRFQFTTPALSDFFLQTYEVVGTSRWYCLNNPLPTAKEDLHRAIFEFIFYKD